MKEKGIVELANKAFNEHRRIVAPLCGFPGVEMTGADIKLALICRFKDFKRPVF
jgi:hypothetical protein